MTTLTKPGADIVATQNQNARLYRQPGGARPNNVVLYSGVEDQFIALEGVSNPIRGGISPVRVADPRRPGSYISVANQEEAPDYGSLTLRVLEKHGSIPFVLGDLTCPMTFYRATGKCARLDDLTSGWTSYVEIVSDVKFTDNDGGTRTSAWDGDEVIDNSLDGTITGSRYAVGQLSFGETAANQVDREVVDIVYGPAVQCGDCGPANDGSQRIYALVKSSGAGSPGITTDIAYTLNGGATWVDTTITGLGATVDADAIDIAGNNLIVVVNASGGYYYSPLDTLGRPTTWTLVTSGFVSGQAPRDLLVIGAGEVSFCADAGRVYKSIDVAAGVSIVSNGNATTQNLRRIHGDGQNTLVAVGDAGAIIISTTGGVSWAAPSSSPTGDRIAAVAVLDQYRYWIGNTIGAVYYTLDSGLTWQQVSVPSATVIDDIVFPTQEVGYIAYRNATPAARLYTTFTGGSRWNLSGASSRIPSLPTFARANRLATPGLSSHPTVASNRLAVAGLSASSSDGVIYVGAADIS